MQNSQQSSTIVWFTGLSGSGKSTLAAGIKEKLCDRSYSPIILDGDDVRYGLCKDLDFSRQGRSENIRRVAEVSKILARNGIIVIAPLISPFKSDRDKVRNILRNESFVEIYVKCPLDVCESRDVKGIYKLAREDKIQNFTGITSPYEPPSEPDLVVDTESESIVESVAKIMSFFRESVFN